MAENLPVTPAFENDDLKSESMCSYSSPDWVAEALEVPPLKQTGCGCRKGKLWARKSPEVCLSKLGKAGERGTAGELHTV